MKMLDSELAAGRRADRRADFHVYYRRNGKLRVDAMWAETAAEASDKMLAFAHELRWRITIDRVVPVTSDA